MGGSNTAGGGLTDIKNRYFVLVNDWWNKYMYSSTWSKLDSYSIAITGTSSDFFGFCLQNFLENNTIPDIVLLEFAINDGGVEQGKAAQPFEVLTRRLMLLPSPPLILYVHLVNPKIRLSGKMLNTKCENMQDMGFDELAKHYGIPSFSIKDEVCPLINGRRVLTNDKREMFASDGSHTSELGHEKMSQMIIKYFQTITKTSELQTTQTTETDLSEAFNKKSQQSNNTQYRFDNDFNIPKPLFIDPLIDDTQLTKPLCFSQTTSNWKLPLQQSLEAKVITSSTHGFKFISPYEARWKGKMRTDSSSGWFTENKREAQLSINFSIPFDGSTRSLGIIFQLRERMLSIEIWLNDKKKTCIKMVNNDSKSPVTQLRLFSVTPEIEPGNYTLTIKGKSKWLNFVGLFAGYRGFHGYKGFKPFEGTITSC